MACLGSFEANPVYFVYLFFVLVSPVRATEQCTTASPQPLYIRLSNCSFSANSAYYPDAATLVDSWGFEVFLGSPPQPLCFEPSTVVNNTVVMTTAICTNDHSSTFDQCVSRRGGLFLVSGSNSNTTSVNSLPPDPGWASFNPPGFTKAVTTTLQFPLDISLPLFPIALPDNAANSSVSQLGLANDSVLLTQLVDTGLSPVRGFSYLAGSQSVYGARDGHIIFGAFDRGSLAGPFTTYPMNSTVTAGSRDCTLHILVEALTLVRPNQSDVPLLSPGEILPSCIEPLDNQFRLPENILDQFKSVTNWSNKTSVAQGIYVVEEGLYYSGNFQGSLTFSLQGGLEVVIPSEELAWPARGLNSMGKRVLQNNITVVNIFSDSAPEVTASLGKVLLSQLLLAVNYDLQIFQLAPANTENVGPLDIMSFNGTSSITCPDVASTSTDHWYIGVIVLACVLVILVIIFCTYLFREHLVIGHKKSSGQAHKPQQIERVPGPQTVHRENNPATLPEVDGISHIENRTLELPSTTSQQDLNRVSTRGTI